MSKRHQRRHRARPQLGSLVTASTGSRLVMAAAAEPLVDIENRTLAGLVVPFGRAGHTSGGVLQFAAGRLSWSSPRRVKLLREHDQHDVVGYATELVELDAAEVDRRMVAAGRDPIGLPGVWGVFSVPAGENGDLALHEAAEGLRDGFSVGVQLDEATALKLRRAQGAAPVDAAGQLRETSLVSVPAFDDARIAAGADLVVSTWATATNPRTTHTTPEGTTVNRRARRDALRAQETLTQQEAAELAGLNAMSDAQLDAPDTGDQAGDQAGAQPQAGTGDQAQAGAQLTTAGAAGPSVVPAVAGAAVVTAEPSTYSFSDTAQHSIVTDLLRSSLRGDSEAGERVARFNQQLAAGNAPSVAAFIEAAATRDNVDGAGTDLPSFFQPSPNRPDLMRAAVDVKRPFISRLDRIPISNAQPFSIPKVGRFEGVGDHEEGTPHRPAGTLTLGGDTLTPKATSGAYEVSRELIDAVNPALDRIASREMLKDYQRQSEGKIITLMAARALQADAVIYGIDTVMELRGTMLDFVNDDDEAGDLVIVSKTMLKTLGLDVDGNDRPQLPYVTPVNAAGTIRAGYTGVAIDGVEIARSARLDGGVGAGSGVLARKDGILWAESSVLQFRFDEVLGPGVVKLALWAYSGAAILDTADVKILSTGAANAVDADPVS